MIIVTLVIRENKGAVDMHITQQAIAPKESEEAIRRVAVGVLDKIADKELSKQFMEEIGIEKDGGI